MSVTKKRVEAKGAPTRGVGKPTGRAATATGAGLEGKNREVFSQKATPLFPKIKRKR